MGRSILAIVLLAGPAAAQPAIEGVVNTASFIDTNLPNGGVAQGGLFTVIGRNLGPGSPVIVSAFPLQTVLGAVSVEIRVGGTTVSGLMIVAFATQVTAILPSNTPPGNGTLTLRFNNQTSAAFPIRIERSRFGIFALNEAGSGPGIFTDPGNVVNTLVSSATPNSVWIIWGTGIGPVTGDEAAGPLPGDLTNLDVQVYVGGRRAEIVYRGRSGCCSGIDQVAFTVPEGVTGCFVPVVLVVGGVPSNTTTISISDRGGACLDAGGLQVADLAKAQADGSLRVATILLERADFRLPVPAPLPSVQSRTDTLAATFGNYNFGLTLIRTQSIGGISTDGACTVYRFSGLTPAFTDPRRPEGLEAGARLMLTGPLGNRIADRVTAGNYSAELGGGTQSIPGLTQNQLPPDYLEPGAYTINNGAGGTGVGAFNAALTLTNPLVWTNQNALTSVTRSQGTTVNWTGGSGAAYITGASVAYSARVGAGFVCRERLAAGSFTIPPEVLLALPPSQLQENQPTGFLSVGTISDAAPFNATGIDLGLLTAIVRHAKVMAYR